MANLQIVGVGEGFIYLVYVTKYVEVTVFQHSFKCVSKIRVVTEKRI